MKLWMRERDQLIEQTMAFVAGVAAAKPVPGIAVLPIEPTAPLQAPPPLPQSRPPVALDCMASERAQIEMRVAKFRKQQEKFQRAREAQYHEIFSKTRATPRNPASP